ncbi:MFS transporter [Thioclava sp. SK-1]|uniref:LysE family translocator n=1 Tax=Thioclava sp. SK-1 TaxID=1889770 RepID=UPI000825B6F8|nr:LysE family translocator [Thioclava sp. SK-1]OCX67013.1 MFS transporter [Thioclava sp. SK-1]
MTLADILSFAFVASLLVMSPGPNGALIAKTVPTSGRAAGFATVAGFVTGFYLHGAMAIFGLSIVLVQSATAFTIVKYLGAAYLCWIGIKALSAAWRGLDTAAPVAPANRRRTLGRAYIEGLLTNALNPKVSMFYLAAFPQFITLGGTTLTASFLLVFIHSMINAVWFGVMVMVMSRLSAVVRGGRFQRWLKGVTGLVFIGFGLKLVKYRPDV